ncbi:MAG: TrkA-N domain protein [Acidobacteria bacterium]|nr:TrkA-N domain protein [Acidobacteriota bacterium]
MTAPAHAAAGTGGVRRPPGPGARSDWFSRARGPWLAVALLVGVCAYGTAGYALVEGWPLWDAFYMTVTTITTVGYKEVHPLTRAGEVLTASVIFAGVGTFFYTFTLLATVVVDGGIHARLARRRRQRMLDDLTDHFIVCGYGRIGAIIVEELRRQGVPYVVIERDRERVMAVMEAGGLAVEADASSEEVLTRLGIARARGLIAAVGTDAENVYAVLTARVLRPDLYIIGRAETEDAERKLKRAGANRVVSPYRIGAREMAQTALRPAVVDFFQLATRSGNLELAIEQVAIGEGSPLDGRSIIDANIRQRYGLIVVGIQRKAGKMEFNPPGDAVMHAGDQLVVLGRTDGLRDLETAAGRVTA